MEVEISDEEECEAAIFKAETPSGEWQDLNETEKPEEKNLIMDVLRRSLRNRNCTKRTVYGVLVTSNLKTFKAFSTPYYTASVDITTPKPIPRFKKRKSHTKDTQTSKRDFLKRLKHGSCSKESNRSYKSSSRHSRRTRTSTRHKATQVRSCRLPSDEVLVKASRSSSNHVQKMQECVYYCTQVLTRSKTKDMRRRMRLNNEIE